MEDRPAWQKMVLYLVWVQPDTNKQWVEVLTIYDVEVKMDEAVDVGIGPFLGFWALEQLNARKAQLIPYWW